MRIKRSMAEGARAWPKLAKSGQGWLKVPGSDQVWPMGIFRALPTDSGEGGWIYSGPQNGMNSSISPCLLLSTGKAGGPQR